MNPNVRNILAIYYQANEQELYDGRNWYTLAHSIASRIGRKYDVHIQTVAAVIAALSPRNRWTRNIQDAEAVICAYINGIDPTTVKVCTFKRNLTKAIEILKGATLDQVLGQKQYSFYRNIYDPTDNSYVTIDGHAYHIWFGIRQPLSKTPSLTPAQYQTIVEAYREAAQILGVKAHQVQAVTWEAYRNMGAYSKD